MNELKQRLESELEQLMLRVRGNRQFQQMLQAYLRLSVRDRELEKRSRRRRQRKENEGEK